MNTTTIRGNILAFEDLNEERKEVIILVHGHPFDHSMWEYQYDILKEFRIINPDLFGYGQSAYEFEKIYIEQQALDLVLLLDKLKIEKVHLMGLSMGGQIIVEFARLFPHRTKSLVICASTPNAENKVSFSQRMANVEEILEIGMDEHTQKTIQKYINIKKHPKGSLVYNHLYKMMTQNTSQGAIASHKGRAERRDNIDYLKEIDVPTLFIAGEFDYFFDVTTIQKAAELTKIPRVCVVNNSGHLPNMEQPEIFNEKVREFYQEINAML